MAQKNVSFYGLYTAVDVSTGLPKTGDVANHTLRWVKDGTPAAPTNTPAEVDATNAPGQYRVLITSAEANAAAGSITGQSSTPNVVIIPTHYAFVDVPALSSVTLGPLVAQREPGNRTASPITLEMFANETRVFTIATLDANGDPVDLSAKTLRFVVHDENTPPNPTFKVEDGSIAKTATTVSITVPAASAATANVDLRFALWSLTDDAVVAHGPFKIKPSSKDTA